MTLHVKPIHDKDTWNNFVQAQETSMYVQSWNYGEFNQADGGDFHVLGLYEDDKLIGGALFLEIRAKRGNFFYSPYSPILDWNSSEQIQIFFAEAKNLAASKHMDFIRISPFVDDSEDLRQRVKDAGFRKAPMHMIAETTWILPLNQDEVDLLANMKQNHRNLIRRAKRDGVEIIKSDKLPDIKKVHDLLKTTAGRHHFVPFSLSYLENEFQAFEKANAAQIYLAMHEGDLLAAAIVFFYGNTVVYKHGASNMHKPKIPASYAIQWAAIQDGMQRGMKYYNFWGIAPDDASKKHPFYGITHFKKGFGGFKRDLLPAHDLPVTKKYWLNFIVETIRRIKRGF